VLRFAQQEGKRRGGHTSWALVAGKWPDEDRIAPPLAQSPPPGKEDRERQREKGTRKRSRDEGDG